MALVCAAPLVLLASANGPVPARTGGFGEMTCHQCHSNNPLRSGRSATRLASAGRTVRIPRTVPSGQLTLSGFPESYTPGRRYTITVAVSHPQLVRAGFQLSARFESGENAGTFEPVDELTEALPDDGGRIAYIQHTAMGATVAAPGAGRWTGRVVQRPD